MWSLFCNILVEATASHVPLISNGDRNKNRKHYPRNVKKTLALKRRKWKAYKAAGRSIRSLAIYKQSCLDLSKQIREHVKCHEANLVASNNLGAFYRYVNKRLKRKSNIGPLKAPTGQLCFNDLQKASLLNSHFASVGTVDNGILPT